MNEQENHHRINDSNDYDPREKVRGDEGALIVNFVGLCPLRRSLRIFVTFTDTYAGPYVEGPYCRSPPDNKEAWRYGNCFQRTASETNSEHLRERDFGTSATAR
eukprot:550899-Prorocentrum_minimum.AAC.3